MRTIKRWVRQKLENTGYVVFNANRNGIYAQDGLYSFPNSHFVDDPRFQSAYRRGVLAGNGVDSRMEWRVHVALWAANVVTGHLVIGMSAGTGVRRSQPSLRKRGSNQISGHCPTIGLGWGSVIHY
jgi:hypothetical protein